MKRVISIELAAAARTCGESGGRWCRFFSRGSEQSSCHLFHCVLLHDGAGEADWKRLARRAAHDLGVAHRWGDFRLDRDGVGRSVSELLPPNPIMEVVLDEWYATYKKALDKGRSEEAPPRPVRAPPPDRSLRCRACLDAEIAARVDGG